MLCVGLPGLLRCVCLFFFFNDTATTEIYTLSLHDALPISEARMPADKFFVTGGTVPEDSPSYLVREADGQLLETLLRDRKSTRLNSSHSQISYAVFCLKKKKWPQTTPAGSVFSQIRHVLST